MAVLGPYFSVNMNGHNSIHSQLTKSLEKILEDAYLSGELKLSGRKLKEFPKPVKYDLSDTVIADLSKNRFSEVPDEVTNYVFLEKLFLSQNVLRHVPDGFGSLQSLNFLDLSSNQLTELPREICQLPIQILLVADNNLTSLPKEIGRMSSLVELEASHNALTQVPITLGDCVALKALDLSNNQLGLLPLQITYLQLEYLNISCNCISSLPLELRNMTSLVSLKLDNNPLVSPPTTVCMRGRVHIFKYLENMANKDNLPTHKRVEDTRRPGKHNSFVGTTAQGHHITSGNATIDCLRHRPRPVVDSGYCTDGVDKRWSNEGGGGSGRSTPSTPSTLSPGAALSRNQSLSSESSLAANAESIAVRTSPEGTLSNGDDKSKLSHQQTYRQYKEALRQQRQQDVYRPRTDNSTDVSPNQHSPVHVNTSPSLTHSSVSLTHSLPSPHSPTLYHRLMTSQTNNSLTNPSHLPTSPLLHSTPKRYQNGEKIEEKNTRPVQKVVPSRNTNKIYPSNGEYTNGKVNGTETYTKPNSPIKSPTSTLTYNGVGKAINGEAKSVSFVKGPNASKMGWNKDLAADKLSFTMKREFDKQKEESELLEQLRTTIESRLKMQLPASLPAVLCDGVVLCHLANQVRPRLVSSVHVPSPAQPKLTMARCRRNVDNFIEACRRIGVDEDELCSAEDVLEAANPCRLARTLAALLAHTTPPASPNDTDSQSRAFTYQQPRAEDNSQTFAYKQRYTEERYVSNFNYSNERYTIDESEEYVYENNEEATYSPVYANDGLKNRSYVQTEKVQFVMPFYKKNGVLTSDSLEIYDTDEVDFAFQNEAPERYDRSKMNLEIKNNLNTQLAEETEPLVVQEIENKNLITLLCLGAFILSAILLFMYPL